MTGDGKCRTSAHRTGRSSGAPRSRDRVQLSLGDEIGFGKFSILFGKAVGDSEPAVPPIPDVPRQPAMQGGEGTMHIKPHEVQELLKESDRKRAAQFLWESGGRQGNPLSLRRAGGS